MKLFPLTLLFVPGVLATVTENAPDELLNDETAFWDRLLHKGDNYDYNSLYYPTPKPNPPTPMNRPTPAPYPPPTIYLPTPKPNPPATFYYPTPAPYPPKPNPPTPMHRPTPAPNGPNSTIPTFACGTTQENGPLEYMVDLRETRGYFDLAFDLGILPKSLDIYHEGANIFSTNGEIVGGLIVTVIPYGNATSKSTKLTVKVSSDDSSWSVTIGCQYPSPPTFACGTMQSYGGPREYMVDLREAQGVFDLYFYLGLDPKSLYIYYEGAIILSRRDETFAHLVPVAYGNATSKSTLITVKVDAPVMSRRDPSWNVSVHCPK